MWHPKPASPPPPPIWVKVKVAEKSTPPQKVAPWWLLMSPNGLTIHIPCRRYSAMSASAFNLQLIHPPWWQEAGSLSQAAQGRRLGCIGVSIPKHAHSGIHTLWAIHELGNLFNCMSFDCGMKPTWHRGNMQTSHRQNPNPESKRQKCYIMRQHFYFKTFVRPCFLHWMVFWLTTCRYL